MKRKAYESYQKSVRAAVSAVIAGVIEASIGMAKKESWYRDNGAEMIMKALSSMRVWRSCHEKHRRSEVASKA